MVPAKSLLQQHLEKTCESRFFSISNQLKKGFFDIQDVGDYIPGNLMVQDLETNTNIYMNKSGCEILKHSVEELQALGPSYFSKFFPADEMVFLKDGLDQFVAKNDPTCIHSFLQRVRPDNKSEYKWYFTSSRLFYADHTKKTNRIMHLAIEANTLNNLGNKLNRIFEENIFISHNYQKFNLLTKREKEIIHLIATGKSSQDISSLLFISKHTVNNHRKNILSKLDLNCISKLIQFAIAFDLI